MILEKAVLVRRAALLPLLVLAMVDAVSAATVYNVNSIADQIDDDTSDGLCHTASGTCTLRAAVMQANRASGPGVTIILPAGLYTLVRPIAGADGDDSGDLNLTTPTTGSPIITIAGAAAATTIIDANQIDRILTVDTGRVARISNLTLQNGLAPNGGAIYERGELSADRVSFINNAASAASGGAIDHESQLPLTVTYCVFDGNHASGGGGGAINTYYGASIGHSTFVRNIGYRGGAINTSRGTQITRSTIAGNTAVYQGGGVWSVAGYDPGDTTELVVTESTISANSAGTDGGGIFTRGKGNIFNSTIAFNDASTDVTYGVGGGIITFLGVLNLRNSVIAGNYLVGASAYEDCFNASSQANSYGRNKLWVAGCSFAQIGPGDVTVLASLNELGVLQDNGGPTQTHALAAPSDMIDGAGDCTDNNGQPLLTDQRDFIRNAGNHCDIGAFEYSSQPDLIFASGFN